MELQPINPRHALRFRSKQEIIHLLEKYESLKKHTRMNKFCKNHDVPNVLSCYSFALKLKQ